MSDTVTEVPVVSARGFGKSFGARPVLSDVDLDVLPGQVHGLLGQNGSGKSTFIKILAGYHHPAEGGTLRVRGTEHQLPLQPTDPRQLGFSFVHQDLGLIDRATVVENMRIGRYDTGFGWRIPWSKERRLVRESLARVGLEVQPDTLVSELRPVDRAMVAILRALEELRAVPRGLLVLDEPTAYLPRDGVDRLFTAVREAARAGHGILFVTHRLEEVHAITDHVTILRDGRVVESAPTSSLDEQALIERILGFALDQLYPEPHDRGAELTARIDHLSGSMVHDFSLSLRRGEIVGLTGLVGMGYEQVPYLLFGAEKALSGEISVGKRNLDARRITPPAAMAAGMALLPADRGRDGGVANATVSENVTLATLGRYYDGGLLRRRRERRQVGGLLDEFEVRPPEPNRSFWTLSGGNQQKALLAKWFETGPRLFLLHEPTQGVDVGARKQIFRQMRDAAESGVSFLFVSSEYEDLANLCDRVVIFRHGRPVSELHGNALTHERILEQCFSR
jgi:ribose transport system ATP-binding protein